MVEIQDKFMFMENNTVSQNKHAKHMLLKIQITLAAVIFKNV